MTNESLRYGLNSLKASRKADREMIAKALIKIADKHGAKVTRRDSPAHRGWCGQSIDLSFRLNGVGASVSIDDLHGGKYALIAWYNHGQRVRYLNARFNRCVGDTGQWRPHHKATSCPADWYSLAMFLDGGLTLAARNEAFIEEEKVA